MCLYEHDFPGISAMYREERVSKCNLSLRGQTCDHHFCQASSFQQQQMDRKPRRPGLDFVQALCLLLLVPLPIIEHSAPSCLPSWPTVYPGPPPWSTWWRERSPSEKAEGSCLRACSFQAPTDNSRGYSGSRSPLYLPVAWMGDSKLPRPIGASDVGLFFKSRCWPRASYRWVL